jgi:hypothetical protein
MSLHKNKTIKKINYEKQLLFFYSVLQTRDVYSEISGDKLYGEFTTKWFHHIYPKSTYPKLRYCPDNIIIVTSDEHDEIEAGKEFPELTKRKKYIAENFDELVESTEEYINNFLNPIYEHATKHTTFFKKSN